MIVNTRAYPRAALIGNPSDGYNGKTIAFTFDNFCAEVVLFESPELEIQPSVRDRSIFPSMQMLVEDVDRHGYYGGIRLLKAAVRRFYHHCVGNGIVLEEKNFTLRYSSTIPHHVGLGGSSAIITACFRALMAFYGVSIPKPALAGIILAVEHEELLISAGLQDRVAQVYQGLVYMDFDAETMRKQGYGTYVPLDPGLLPSLFIAYRTDLSEGSEVFHNNIRERYGRDESEVVEAMRFWAGLTDRFRELLAAGDSEGMAKLMDDNFDRRRRIYRISEGNLKMVEAARAAGACAKFSGSGGAIVGIYRDAAMLERLRETLGPMGIEVVAPRLVGGKAMKASGGARP
jgi:glucuronokinase